MKAAHVLSQAGLTVLWCVEVHCTLYQTDPDLTTTTLLLLLLLHLVETEWCDMPVVTEILPLISENLLHRCANAVLAASWEFTLQLDLIFTTFRPMNKYTFNNFPPEFYSCSEQSVLISVFLFFGGT